MRGGRGPAYPAPVAKALACAAGKTGLVEVRRAEPVPAGREILAAYLEKYRDDPEKADFVAFLQGDFGRRVGTFRMLATRTGVPVHLEDEDGDVPY